MCIRDSSRIAIFNRLREIQMHDPLIRLIGDMYDEADVTFPDGDVSKTHRDFRRGDPQSPLLIDGLL